MNATKAIGRAVLQRIGRRERALPRHDTAPARAELFGIERLEQHAVSLARAQPVTALPPRVPALHQRLRDNAAVLSAGYRASAAEIRGGREGRLHADAELAPSS